MPSLIFSYTFSAREGAAYKARDTLSSRIFSKSRTPSTLLSQKYVFPRLTHLLCGAFEHGYKAATEALCASPMINISEVKPRFYERYR